MLRAQLSGSTADVRAGRYGTKAQPHGDLKPLYSSEGSPLNEQAHVTSVASSVRGIPPPQTPCTAVLAVHPPSACLQSHTTIRPPTFFRRQARITARHLIYPPPHHLHTMAHVVSLTFPRVPAHASIAVADEHHALHLPAGWHPPAEEELLATGVEEVALPAGSEPTCITMTCEEQGEGKRDYPQTKADN